MAGGLSASHFVIENDVVLVVLLSLLAVGYALICLYTSQEFQLKVAKLLTIIFSLLMAFVAVGMAAQASIDLYERENPTTSTPLPTTPHNITKSTEKSLLAVTKLSSTTASQSLADRLPADVSSLYLAGLVGIFVLAAILHPPEAGCLVHGVWYLLCLPSGYLLLIVYSICNMTDRSWGELP